MKKILILCLLLSIVTISCKTKLTGIDYLDMYTEMYVYHWSSDIVDIYDDGTIQSDWINVIILCPRFKRYTVYSERAPILVGAYTEHNDTLILSPSLAMDFTSKGYDDIKLHPYEINDSTSFNYADCPQIYVRQKDGSIEELRRYLPSKIERDSIEYEGVKYSLQIDKMSNWDYREYPKPVRDSISKLLDIYTLRIKYLPVKYSRRKHTKKQTDISLQRISIDDDDDE